MAEPYDSRPETQAHIDRVCDFLALTLENLEARAQRHDASKLVEPELSAFDIATPKLARLEYGSEDYKQSLRDLGPALQHHFEARIEGLERERDEALRSFASWGFPDDDVEQILPDLREGNRQSAELRALTVKPQAERDE